MATGCQTYYQAAEQLSTRASPRSVSPVTHALTTALTYIMPQCMAGMVGTIAADWLYGYGMWNPSLVIAMGSTE